MNIPGVQYYKLDCNISSKYEYTWSSKYAWSSIPTLHSSQSLLYSEIERLYLISSLEIQNIENLD